MRRAVQSLADSLHMTTGDLIRTAVEAQYGDDLRPHLAFFRTMIDQYVDQMSDITTGTKKGAEDS